MATSDNFIHFDKLAIWQVMLCLFTMALQWNEDPFFKTLNLNTIDNIIILRWNKWLWIYSFENYILNYRLKNEDGNGTVVALVSIGWAAVKGIYTNVWMNSALVMFLYLWQRFWCDSSCLELIFHYQVFSLLLQGKQIIKTKILKQLCQAILVRCKMLKDIFKSGKKQK